MQRIAILLCLLLLSVSALAAPAHKKAARPLSAAQLERAGAVKAMLGSVDTRPTQALIDELEHSPRPEMALRIKEAMAKAYVDIVKEQHVEGQSKKDWLYSMVKLNMAYFQFAGAPNQQNTTELNKVIRRKLITYLPPNIFEQPGFHQSVD